MRGASPRRGEPRARSDKRACRTAQGARRVTAGGVRAGARRAPARLARSRSDRRERRAAAPPPPGPGLLHLTMRRLRAGGGEDTEGRKAAFPLGREGGHGRHSVIDLAQKQRLGRRERKPQSGCSPPAETRGPCAAGARRAGGREGSARRVTASPGVQAQRSQETSPGLYLSRLVQQDPRGPAPRRRSPLSPPARPPGASSSSSPRGRPAACSAALEPGAGVGGVVDLLELLEADPGVDLGGGRGLAWPSICWMKRMSAPPSSIRVAAVWRKRWQPPLLPTPACFMSRGHQLGDVVGADRRSPRAERKSAPLVRVDHRARPRLPEVLARSRRAARSPMGTKRSLLPLPWRTESTPRPSSRSLERRGRPAPSGGCRWSRGSRGWPGRAGRAGARCRAR